MVRRRRGWSSSTPPSPLARLTRCSTTSTLLKPVTMFMIRCWKQEEVKVVEVELLPLFVQLFLVSCLRQLSSGKHRHSHLLLISLFSQVGKPCSVSPEHHPSLLCLPLLCHLALRLHHGHGWRLFFWYFILFLFFIFFFCTLFHFPSSSQLPPGNHFYPQVIIEKLWSFQLPILQPDLISYQVSPVKLRIIMIILISDYCNYYHISPRLWRLTFTPHCSSLFFSSPSCSLFYHAPARGSVIRLVI